MEGSPYCGVHGAMAGEGPDGGSGPAEGSDGGRHGPGDAFSELGETARTLLGLAAVGLIVLIGMTWGRRF